MTSSAGKTNRPNSDQNSVSPSISLPKGGGAIRGIGEKFGVNPVTGTGSMSVPIATSPGRSGFGPELALSYDSGAGNGPFGFGWNLSLPAITRKTDKGLPQYHDAKESDVFLLSSAEDLVPVLEDGAGFEDNTTVLDYTIHRYRPRIEGLFARIERWTHRSDGDVHWRSISKDNILTIYGKDAGSRITDPDNSGNIFSWLICETRDDKGNAILYEYKPEDGIGVKLDYSHERNRGDRNAPRRTVNRYLKHIRYSNRTPLLNNRGKRPRFLTDLPDDKQPKDTDWMFQVVFDYGEHDPDTPKPDDSNDWHFRNDPFSVYRAGFEVRTTRLCRRVLMFHHFPGEEGVGNDCLVRSTDFTYSHEENSSNVRNPVYTFLRVVTQSGYKFKGDGYLKGNLPPVEFEYTQPIVQDKVEEVDPKSLENLPIGVDGSSYQWIDLHGEGIPGILTEQAGAWFYKRNFSPIGKHPVEFAPLEPVATKPNLALTTGAQFMDLAGDGQLDLVVLDAPTPGLYEHDTEEGWQPFRPFTSRLNHDTRDPNLKFVDLDGDGHADVFISEDDAFVWYASLAEEGFGPARRVAKALDEEKGPHLVFADGTQSMYLADLSGDGLTDLVRVRNGEICYWPNLGYGRFGCKISMDNAPNFDHLDQFNHKRIRLTDIDGTGTTDIIYLHRDGVRLYFNQSGNSWSKPQVLNVFPRVDDLVSIVPADLLGNGTACLVWSSPLPGDTQRPIRYVNLMGSQKPHLLIKTINNLGAETRLQYAPSTKFYLQDKYDGIPWITKLPFPVHVIERVETFDHISRNRLITRYAYHHGYFDGEEREFRGFGMVEQWDTEELAVLTGDDTLPEATNVNAASHVPPVHTKTWFHTGVYLGRDHISDFFAGLLNMHDKGEYYREPGLNDTQAQALLLKDTVLPDDLTNDEAREACRSLKGATLRQEVYALDGTPKEPFPYAVTEQNFSIRLVQPRKTNRHAIFFTHPREAINYHYERNHSDPRIQHTLTLEVDDFGNVLKEAAIGYGRRQPDAVLPLQVDRDKQTRLLISYRENEVTHAIDDSVGKPDGSVKYPDDYRAPLPCETRTYELTGFKPENSATRFSFDEWTRNSLSLPGAATEINYEETADDLSRQKRLVEHLRTLYRKDNLTALLPLGELEPLSLPGESYKLAFTPGLLLQVFQRDGQNLLPNPATILAGQGTDRGGYMVSQHLKTAGNFPNTDPDDHWWIPTGRIFLSPDNAHTAAQERGYAQDHFFLPHRHRDPFHTSVVSTESTVTYDVYDLLMLETRDALNNRVTVGERLPNGDLDPTKPGNDYRVLQPKRAMDPNRNRSQVAFDAMGMVVGTAVMGKPEETIGDSLDGFSVDLTATVVLNHLANPLTDPHTILGRASTRLVYDLFAYQRTKHQSNPQPAVVYTLARETHDSELAAGEQTKIQHSFSYSDGFGREIQKKIQAEPEKTNGVVGPPRWIGSGWTIFNNKGKPVRQYEPFFSNLPPGEGHRFEFGVQVGVSPILFYDPVGRVVATLHPNHTYEKVVFDPWCQTSYDVNDNATINPGTDDDVKGFILNPDGTPRIPTEEYLPTWYELRTDPLHTTEFETHYPDATDRLNQKNAATKTAAHVDTPTTAYFDTLGRPFLTVAHNKVKCPNHELDGTEDKVHTRVELDIEGDQLAIRDAIKQSGDAQGRIVMRYTYDMLGNRIHQLSMEAGARWILKDVAGKPIRAWDSRGHAFRTDYDPLRRLLRSFVTGAAPANPNQELLTERLVYGEQHPEADQRKLRGALHLHLDQAGAITTEAHDFKGNPLHSSRRIATEYKQTINWNSVDAALSASATVPFVPATLEMALTPLLENDIYTSRTTYDALNRPVTLTTPHTPSMQPSIIRPGYNEANLLERVDANLRGAASNGQPVWTPFVTNIDYDAKGQRERVDYGNGVNTFYSYDPLTFRLKHQLTRRNAITFPDDCPQPPPTSWPGCQVQNLHYTYDPVGNITRIRDDAQQTIFFKNKRVEPSADYTYDALYQLIEATGREHLGQVGGAPIPHSHNDALRVGINMSANDGNVMGMYIERYVYDALGNFLKMQHRGSDPTHAGWTRSYTYDEISLIEDGTGGTLLKQGNRLSNTAVGNGNRITEHYVYDTHGNMIRMPHLGGAYPAPNMHWDYRDQLRQTGLGGGGTAYYTYDASGERVRKVWEKSANLVEERFYLGDFEIYRKRQGADRLERETLHIMDDKQRVALVETRTLDTAENDQAPRQLIRYQFGNYLSSTSLELDHQAKIISYEEYTPYGSTSYQAVRSKTETPKRYRYTGKERDKASGLGYHNARYYAPWIGCWTSPDSEALQTHPTDNGDRSPRIDLLLAPYRYGNDNPIIFQDPSGRDPVKKVFSKLIRKLATRGSAKLVARAAKAEMKKVGTRVASGVGIHGIPAHTSKHIALHFARDATQKATHAVFVKGLRSMKKLTPIIQKTLKKPSLAPHLSVTDTGHLAIVFERTFKEAIGDAGERVLRVVVDHKGKLISAFPVSKTAKVVTRSGVRIAAGRAVLPAIAIVFAGASEARAAHEKSEQEIAKKFRESQSHWTDWILPDFLVSSPLGDGTLAPVRRREAAFKAYAKAAESRVEKQQGSQLSPAQRDSLRGLLRQVWF